MPLNQGSTLRQPGNTVLEEFLSERGETLEQNKKRRRGGLNPDNANDHDEIKLLLTKKIGGHFREGEEEAWALLNPKIQTLLQNTPESTASRIGKQFFTPAQPAVQAQPAEQFIDEAGAEFGIAQPGLISKEAVPAQEARPSSFDAEAAAREARGAGDFDLANKILGGQQRRTDKFFETDDRGNQFRVQVDSHGDLISRRSTGINVHDKPIKQFSDALTKSKVALSAPPIKIIKSVISEARQSGGEIEGVGNLKNKSPSAFFLTSKGKRMRRAVQEIENLKLNLLSGAAVSAHEAVRQAISNARELSSTAEDYVNAFEEQILPAWSNTLEVIKSSVSPEVFDEYMRRNPNARKIFESFELPQKRQTSGGRRGRGSNLKKMSDEDLLNAF